MRSTGLWRLRERTRTRWLDDGLIPLVASLMRVAWLTPLLYYLLHSALVYPRGVPYPLGLILALLLGASALQGALQERRAGPALLALAGVLALLAVLAHLFSVDTGQPLHWLRGLFSLGEGPRDAYPAGLVVTIVTALIWMRGLAASWLDYGELFQGYVVGVVVLGFLLLVPDPRVWEGLQPGLGVHVAGFVLSALASLGLVSAHHTLAQEQREGRWAPTLIREWLLVVGGVVLLASLAGALLARTLAPSLTDDLVRLIRPLWDLAVAAILYVLLGISYVLFTVLTPLITLAQRIAAQNWDELLERLESFLSELRALAAEPREASAAANDLNLIPALRAVGVALLIGGLALALVLAIRRRRRQGGSGDDERESVLSRALLRQQLESLLQRRQRPATRSPYLPLDGDDPRRAIRLLYRRLLGQAAARGQARPPRQTPRAYAGRLRALWPGEGPALETLTEAYLAARYAPDPPTPQQVEAARRAWAALEAAAEHDERLDQSR